MRPEIGALFVFIVAGMTAATDVETNTLPWWPTRCRYHIHFTRVTYGGSKINLSILKRLHGMDDSSAREASLKG